MTRLTIEEASQHYAIPLLALHVAIDRGLLQTDENGRLESANIEKLIGRLLKSFYESVNESAQESQAAARHGQ
jgi:hypothetical protein